jgi:hypothetical protein
VTLTSFTPGEIASGTHWIGGWVDHGVGLAAMEKKKILPLPGIENQAVQTLSPSLQLLSYLGSNLYVHYLLIN